MTKRIASVVAAAALAVGGVTTVSIVEGGHSASAANTNPQLTQVEHLAQQEAQTINSLRRQNSLLQQKLAQCEVVAQRAR